MFTEANPDKGTKTNASILDLSTLYKFTEANPDKGTKTNITLFSCISFNNCLQKLTPIRGRKLLH